MFYVSPVYTTVPADMKSPVRKEIYDTLVRLGIPFGRVDTDPAETMELCLEIDKVLGIRIVKTLLLCNQQKTKFYMLAMKDDKPFVTRDFSRAMGIARVSFASAETLYAMLGTPRGAATVLSLVRDPEKRVQLVFDREILEGEWYGCTDGVVDGYMKLRTADLLEKYIPATGHEPAIIELP